MFRLRLLILFCFSSSTLANELPRTNFYFAGHKLGSKMTFTFNKESDVYTSNQGIFYTIPPTFGKPKYRSDLSNFKSSLLLGGYESVYIGMIPNKEFFKVRAVLSSKCKEDRACRMNFTAENPMTGYIYLIKATGNSKKDVQTVIDQQIKFFADFNINLKKEEFVDTGLDFRNFSFQKGIYNYEFETYNYQDNISYSITLTYKDENLPRDFFNNIWKEAKKELKNELGGL